MGRTPEDAVLAVVLSVAAVAIAGMGFFGGILLLHALDDASGAAFGLGVAFLVIFELAIASMLVFLGWHIWLNLTT